MTENSPLYAAADRAQLTAVCRADLALLEHLDRLSESRRCSARTASRRSTPSCACSSAAARTCPTPTSPAWSASATTRPTGAAPPRRTSTAACTAPRTLRSSTASRPAPQLLRPALPPGPRLRVARRGPRAGLGAAGALGRRPLADRHRRRDPRALAAERPVSYL